MMRGSVSSRISRIMLLAASLFVLIPGRIHAQYLHVEGKKILDRNNEEIILRGMGLGGWMLQEGYMLETSDFAGPQYQIRSRIVELIGEANTQEFYDAWLTNHCTRRDIDSLASWGFNSIRLPMHYNLFTLPIQDEPVQGQNTWLEKGFALTDSLLDWCSDNGMYLILDLHAAPGGQGRDAAISDYSPARLSLWDSEANKEKAIALWRKLAERYADEPWIGAYDLINEPNWNFTVGQNQNGCDETSNAPLRALYVAITNTIRAVDQNHMIIIEGNCWGNNYNGIFPKWDNNMVASFHKYWNNNDLASIQSILDMREQQNIPLWLGESGENSNTWFTNAIRLVEENHIGWSWWPLKKVGSVVNPLTIVKNDDYDVLLNYWKNGGTKPTVDFSKDALMQLAENLRIENNIYRKDVTDAMFRQVVDGSAIPYKDIILPGQIHLTDYDLGRNGSAYRDVDTANYHVASGTYTAWNSGWNYRNDGVDIEETTDADMGSNGYDIGWTQDGEWLQYTLRVDSTAAYNVTLRYAALNNGCQVKLNIDNADISPATALPATGGYQNWANFTFNDLVLYKGTRRLKFSFVKGGANVGFLNFILDKSLADVAFKAVAAETSAAEKEIYLSLNKLTDATTITGLAGFTCQVNGVNANLTSVQADPYNGSRLILVFDHDVSSSDIITISYQGSDVKATDATSLQVFSNLAVTNKILSYFTVPSKIEAEDFAVNQGLQLEATTDAGGGQNVGYTNAGDYLEYYISVAVTGIYPLEVRIACESTAGILEFEQRTLSGEVLSTARVNVPVTSGWQSWETVYSSMKLYAGKGILRVKITKPEFNLNWFRFGTPTTGVEDYPAGLLVVYPNPAGEMLHVELPENLQDKDVTLLIRSVTGNLCRNIRFHGNISHNTVYVGDLPAGMYLLELQNQKSSWRGKLLIER